MQSRHLKILGLSLLALVGIMVVSASAAQAEWLLLLNKESVSELTLNVEMLRKKLSVAALELEIECTGGTKLLRLKVIEGAKKLETEGTATFTGCVVVGGEEFCEVHSPGDPDGTLKSKAVGAKVDDKKETDGSLTVLSLLESNKFMDVEIDGELCAVAEIDAEVNGSIVVSILDALKDLATHLLHLDDEVLKYGAQAATLSSNEGAAVLGHAKDLDPTATWAIHLVGLP